MTVSWTQEKFNKLKYMWNVEGLTASQISEELGVSRSAVCSKARRSKLADRGQGVTSGVKKIKASPRRPATHELHKAPTRIVPVKTAKPETPEPLNIPLLDLEKHHCRWPLGDPRNDNFGFCGLPKADGVSYCKHHSRWAFNPAARRKK